MCRGRLKQLFYEITWLGHSEKTRQPANKFAGNITGPMACPSYELLVHFSLEMCWLTAAYFFTYHWQVGTYKSGCHHKQSSSAPSPPVSDFSAAFYVSVAPPMVPPLR